MRTRSVSKKIPRHAGKFSPCLGSTLRDYLRRTERAMIEASGDAVRAPRGVEDSEMHAHQEAGSGTAATSPRTAAQNPADRGAGTAPGPAAQPQHEPLYGGPATPPLTRPDLPPPQAGGRERARLPPPHPAGPPGCRGARPPGLP